jgi:hypothetical protein
MRFLLTISFFVISLHAFTQHFTQLKHDVEALTDSAMHGRGYVHDGSGKAARYIGERFRQMGLEPIQGSYFQAFNLSVNVYEYPTQLEIDGLNLQEGQDYIAEAWSGISSGRFKLQHFDSTHFQAVAKPKLKPGRAPAIRTAGIDSPEEVAALHDFKEQVIEQSPVLLITPHKLTWSVGQRRYAHAVVEVRATAFPERAKSVKLHVTPEMRSYEAQNVVGKISGLRSDSCIVVTAHYDHLGRLGNALFPGASDNASGVATMLDLAAYFQENKPPMDMVFIAFAAEEAGLLGSKHFVENPLIPLDKMRFLVNLDLMGSAATGITIVNGTLYQKEVARIGAINKDMGLVPKIRLRGKAANSDHYWFAEAGVPAIFIYTEGKITAYHDVHDVAEGLDWTHYEGLFTLLRTFIETF